MKFCQFAKGLSCAVLPPGMKYKGRSLVILASCEK